MDPKEEKRLIKELKNMKKKELREMAMNLADEHENCVKKYKTVEGAKEALETALFNAIDAKDNSTTEIIKSKMTVLKDELDRLSKREKALTEELELVRRAEKNDYDGKSAKWTTIGAWLIGISTTALSAWGITKSHKAFNDGSMVDKTTKGLAERLSGFLSFMNFKK